MPRPSKPWYWKARDSWMVTIRGKRHMLSKGKASRNAAYREYLMLSEATAPDTSARSSAERVCSMFLDHAAIHLKPRALAWHKMFLGSFSAHVKGMDANSVKPMHVSEFLVAYPKWNSSTRYSAITSDQARMELG